MDSEKRPVKMTREELESILFKSEGRSYGATLAVPLLCAATVVCILLLVVMLLPQSLVDRWVQRLQSGRQAVAQSSLLRPESLELLELDDDWTTPLFSVRGMVRNKTNQTLQGVEAVVKLYGQKGPVTTLVVDLDEPSLGLGRRGGFRASYKYTSDSDPLKTYDLSFKLKDGTPVLHQDLRGVLPDK